MAIFFLFHKQHYSELHSSQSHVKSIMKSAVSISESYQSSRPPIPTSVAETLIQVFITSHLIWTTAVESCMGHLVKLSIDFSLSKDLLPGILPAPNYSHKYPQSSFSSSGFQLYIGFTKKNCSGTNGCMAVCSSVALLHPSPLYSVLELVVF